MRSNGNLERAIIKAWPDAAFVVDARGVVTWANDMCETVLGWPVSEVIGRNVLDFTHPDDVALVLTSIESVQQRGVGAPIEVRSRTPGGEWRSFEIVGRDCLADPDIAGILCTSRDLSKRRMWEVARGDDVRIHWVVHHIPAVLLLLDANGLITSANGALTRLLGWDPSDIVGRRLASFAGDDAEQGRLAAAIAGATPARSAVIEVMMAAARERPGVPMRFEIINMLDDPVVASMAVTGYDISELYEARRRLEHLADHDALTDLANRGLLARRLSELLAARRPLAVLYVDLDRFKPVNDLHSHAAGDEVLRRVARRLEDAVAATDVVARVGGDEFVILAVGVSEAADAVSLAERIQARIEEPFDLPNGVVSIGASIGVALAGPGSNADALLHEADLAMYGVKEPGRAVSHY